MFLLPLLFGALGLFESSAQKTSVPDRPRVLQISGERKMSVPTFAAWGYPKSDVDGHLFFNLDDGPMSSTVLEVNPESSDHPKIYKLPKDVSEQVYFLSYSVTPTGAVWMIANRKDFSGLEAFEISSSGDVKQHARVEVPLTVNITDFQALENRLFMVGFYSERAPVGQQGQPFSGIFDENGKLITAFSHNIDMSNVSIGSATSHAHEGTLVADPAGNIYFLNQTRIFVLNSAGELKQKISFKKPTPEWLPVNLSVSGNLLAVWLQKAMAEKEPDRRTKWSFLVIDLATREPIGWYEPDPAGGNGAIGFSRDEGFKFIQAEGGNFKIVYEQRR